MKPPYRTVTTDVLVIGGGGAGVHAALEAAELGAKVILASKGPLAKCGLTPTANGGYNAPIVAEDSPGEYLQDLVHVGRGLNDRRLVKALSEEALPCLKSLEKMGANVGWKLGTFPPSKHPRSAFIPGKMMVQVVGRDLLTRPNVVIHEAWSVLRLVADGGRVAGAVVLDLKQGTLVSVRCASIILATGGLCEIFHSNADSPMGIPTGAEGEGCWLAAEAGCELIEMEMIQFVTMPVEPLMYGLRHLPWGPFYNSKGERVVDPGTGPYSPLAALRLVTEEIEGRGPVTIDLTGKPFVSTARHRNARARENFCLRLGLTPYQGRIRVRVGALFGMGGVRISEHCETTVRGLYAAGEVTGGVHGACRVAGTALPEIAVFGRRAGKNAAQFADANTKDHGSDIHEHYVALERERINDLTRPKESPERASAPYHVKAEIQEVMDKYVQVLRNEDGLTRAESELTAIEADRLPKVGVSNGTIPMNLALIDALSLPSMLNVARMVVASAKARRESRGAHYRTDYPSEGETPLHTSLSWRDGSPRVELTPVDRI